MGARREVLSSVRERYWSAKRAAKGRILDELCATTGWHRKHSVRALKRRENVAPGEFAPTPQRRRRYGATIKDTLTALWEASDRVCGKRLKVMIPVLLPALEHYGRLNLGKARWCAFIDGDEFLCPRTPQSVPELLASLDPSITALYVHWMFGSSGYRQRPEGLVTETYTKRGRESYASNSIGKAILRLEAGIGPNGVHVMKSSGRMVNDACVISTKVRQFIRQATKKYL